MTDVSLTPETYRRLREELEELTGKGRVEIARAIEAARALGDRCENGDYHAAKEAQGKMEARIRQLQHLLSSATVVDQADHHDRVTQGSIVSLKYEGDDEIQRFLVGSIEEKREDVTVVSPASPLGQALMDKGIGDTVTYEAPSGKLQVEIVNIEPGG